MPSIVLDHTIVPSRDKERGARFLEAERPAGQAGAFRDVSDIERIIHARLLHVDVTSTSSRDFRAPDCTKAPLGRNHLAR